LPSSRPVSVIVTHHGVKGNAWVAGRWDVAGAVAGRIDDTVGRKLIHDDGEVRQYLCSGLRVELYRDDAESYYYNLMGERPSLFVICRQEAGEALRPVLLTLSYDETVSYMEVDDAVYSVPMPPDIYRWVEKFVLTHYVPEKKKKRKRDDWKEAADNGRFRRS
jgi:hypothetical protein